MIAAAWEGAAAALSDCTVAPMLDHAAPPSAPLSPPQPPARGAAVRHAIAPMPSNGYVLIACRMRTWWQNADGRSHPCNAFCACRLKPTRRGYAGGR